MEGSRGVNGGEVRRIHIMYLLTRLGRVEHPHLIRVHHLNRNGVYLRDVKRWMSDLRGKDVAESFTWSYKRRYKNVYVWQDILDDDLITPICDNEYVLKGSQILPLLSSGILSENEKQAGVEIEARSVEHSSQNEENHISPDNSFDLSTKTSSEIYQESPIFGSERSTLTDDSTTQEQSSPTKHSMNKKNQRNGNKGDDDDDVHEKLGSPSSESNSAKSKSYSNGASKMLRNLITCGAVDTNDAALVSINKSSISRNVNYSAVCKGEIVTNTNWKQQQYTSARRSLDGVEGSKKNQQQKSSRFGNSKDVPAAYRPVGAPICLQCGKSFRPEKLHAHMKSCKGLKASSKTSTDSVKNTSTNSMGPLQRISFEF